MTARERDYDELIRRTLHSIADPIEPVGDGLARIRGRIDQPWYRRQLELLHAESADLVSLMLARCEPGVDRLKAWLATCHKVAAPALRRISPVFAWPRSTFAWLRASLAVGTAVLIVVAAVYAVRVNQSVANTEIRGTGSVSHQGQQTGPVEGPSGIAAPPTSSAPSPGPGTRAGSVTPRPTHSPPAPSCSPTATPAPSTSSTPVTTSPSPTPTPTTPTASPAPTGTTTSPSPTGTSAATPDPMGSASSTGDGQAAAMAVSGSVMTRAVHTGRAVLGVGNCGGSPSPSPAKS